MEDWITLPPSLGSRYEDGSGRNGRNRERSHSVVYGHQTPQEQHRRLSTPVRWHPQYAQPTEELASLETIPEDTTSFNNNNNFRMYSYPQTNVISSNYYNNDNNNHRRYSHVGVGFTDTSQFSYKQHRSFYERSASERVLNSSKIQRVAEEEEEEEEEEEKVADEKNQSRFSSKPNYESKNRRRKSQIGFDAASESDIRTKISDARSVKSGRSKGSFRKYSKTDDNASRYSQSRRSSSTRRPPSSTSGNERRKTSRSSSRMSVNSSRSQARSHSSFPSGGDPEPVTAVSYADSALDNIPPELMNGQSSYWKKILRPLLVTVLVLTLVVSLFVAVFFAAALKEFLQATLEFTLSQNQRSRDFNTLTSSEAQELKRAYCRQVDDWYRGSLFNDDYRGCHLDVLTNERIEFKLYFLDETGPPKGAVEIMSILAKEAEPVAGLEGKRFVKISDVTLDLSPSSASVDIAVTSKPKDFHGSDSPQDKGDRKKEDQMTMKPTLKSTTPPTTELTTTLPSTTTSSPSPSTSSSTSPEPQGVNNTELSEAICQTMEQYEVIAHPYSCSHYIQCQFDQPIARPCSGGLVFDPRTRACVKPRNDLPCTKIDPCTNLNGGHFAHPTNCRLFVICDQGKSVMLSCPSELVWDETSQNCVPRNIGTNCEPSL